ncbi:hypothetical protein BRAS3843_140005 [Bradyrhizobium sp. STM 3843]|nr:hypothetical protein BRAS3843_140005 [Bradyrhizobium sp. STM 3843]
MTKAILFDLKRNMYPLTCVFTTGGKREHRPKIEMVQVMVSSRSESIDLAAGSARRDMICIVSPSGNVRGDAAACSFCLSLTPERTADKIYGTVDEARARVFHTSQGLTGTTPHALDHWLLRSVEFEREVDLPLRP